MNIDRSAQIRILGRTRISDNNELKRRIKNEWVDLNHAVIEQASGASVYVLAFALGGNFEHVM